MRCGTCGAQVKRGLGVCPACGASLGRVRVLGRRLRCRACQKRVPSGLRICPYCGAPLRGTLRRWIQVLLALVLVEGMIYAGMHYVPWHILRALWRMVRVPEVAFLATPTFTATATTTRTVTPTATRTPTATWTPVPPTGTPIPPSPTATRTATRTVAASSSSRSRLPAPRLLSPADGLQMRGSDGRALQWDVTVMRQTGTKPDGGRDGVAVSAPDDQRSF